MLDSFSIQVKFLKFKTFAQNAYPFIIYPFPLYFTMLSENYSLYCSFVHLPSTISEKDMSSHAWKYLWNFTVKLIELMWI